MRRSLDGRKLSQEEWSQCGAEAFPRDSNSVDVGRTNNVGASARIASARIASARIASARIAGNPRLQELRQAQGNPTCSGERSALMHTF